MTILSLLIKNVVIIVVLIISQITVGTFTNFLFGRINYTAQELKKDKKLKDSDIKLEAANIDAIKIKKEKLGFITKIVGVLEVLFFGFLVGFLIEGYRNNLNNPLGSVIIFFQFLAGWLTIKTLGNYQQWASSILGRACFYAFILGTCLNIVFAISLGVVLTMF